MNSFWLLHVISKPRKGRMTVAYVPNHSQIMAKLNLKDSGERHNENFNILLYVKVFRKKQADCTDINLTCGTAASYLLC